MNKTELSAYTAQPINYRIAEIIGAGVLNVGTESVTITVADSKEGIVGVEPIKLTAEQWGKITVKDDRLYLEV